MLSEVVAVTVSDDADISAWSNDEDVTIRLVRGIVAGCRAGTQPFSSLEEACNTQRMIDAIYASAASGQSVDVA